MGKNETVSTLMAATIQIVLLFLITFLMLAVSLVPALLEWYSKSDAEPLRVVREQDTSIRHFASSFRTQINTFFDDHAIDLGDPPEAFDTVWHVDEPVTFLGGSAYPEFVEQEVRERLVHRVLIGGSDLSLPGDMVFEEEVYCCGGLTTGDRTAFRALYSEREITLGRECVVVRWLHSDGEVTVGAGSQLFGRLSADQGVNIGPGCTFERMSSPVMRFSTRALGNIGAVADVEREDWVPVDDMEAIDEETWKTVKDLSIADNVSLDKNLIAKRALTIGEHVKILGDIKADASLVIGPGSLIRGALVCGGPIEIGEGCLVKGPIISETAINIRSGCIIGAPAMPTTVSAPRINVTPGAQVSGSMWAGVAGFVEN